MYAAVTRRIDELGRVVLPQDARNAMNLAARDAVQISWEGDKMVIKKAHPTCRICGSENELNKNFFICKSCMEKLKAE